MKYEKICVQLKNDSLSKNKKENGLQLIHVLETSLKVKTVPTMDRKTNNQKNSSVHQSFVLRGREAPNESRSKKSST